MSASWYDVLGVAPDAAEAEIRAAWRGSIQDLDPTDRRFALYNEAAGVLLDRERRSAYDAELAGGRTEPEASAGDQAGPATTAAGWTSTTAGDEPSVISEVRRKRRPWARRDGTADTRPGTAPPAAGKRALPAVPTWLLVALALATVVVAGLALWLQLDSEDGADVESALSDARQAAESSVPKVFTYDYRFPERDRDQGARVLTGDLKDDYERLWDEAITPNLAATQATAQSEVVATGAVNGSDERAEVLVVLNSVTGNKSQKQQLTLALTVSLVQEGGRWLIAKMDGWDPDQVTDEGGSDAPSPTQSPAPSPTE